jgi:hypothetical protein
MNHNELNHNELRKVATSLFDLQYSKNGLYGHDISFRMVTDNKSFHVSVFHNGIRIKYVDIRSLEDVEKLEDSIWG